MMKAKVNDVTTGFKRRDDYKVFQHKIKLVIE